MTTHIELALAGRRPQTANLLPQRPASLSGYSALPKASISFCSWADSSRGT